MAYLWVKDFKRGLDTRRMIETLEDGALIVGDDGHITRGGEFEGRKSFVQEVVLPVGETAGLWVDEDRNFHVFSDHARPGGFTDADVTWHEVPHQDGVTALSRILSVDEFNGKLYVVCEYADGSRHHYYGTQRVTNEVQNPDAGGSTANVALGDGRAWCSTRISIGRKSDGALAGDEAMKLIWFIWNHTYYDLMDPATPIVYDTGVHKNAAGFAKAVADAVNAYASDPKVYAVSSGDTIVFQMATVGAEYNGAVLQLGGSGYFYQEPFPGIFNGGEGTIPVGPPPAPEPPGAFDGGSFAKPYKRKMFSVKGRILNISGVDTPHLYTADAVGGDTRDMTNQAGGQAYLESLSEYQNYLAFFGRRQIQVWFIDPDPAQDQLIQTLQNTGTFAPRSVTPYGSGDVFYLSFTGVRSLRARDSSNAAYASDVGNAVDTLVQEAITTLGETTAAQIGCGLMDPVDGRFWLCLGDEIFVFSHFQDTKIAAWTRYKPGFSVSYVHANSRQVFLRSGDTIYSYGGPDGATYDSTEPVVRLPFMSAGEPATFKKFRGIDLAIQGEWEVRAYMDPAHPDVYDTIGKYQATTFSAMKMPMAGRSTHVSLELIGKGAGYKRLGNVVIHYDKDKAA